HDLGAHDGAEPAKNSEVHDRVAVETGAARQSRDHVYCHQEGDCDKHPIRSYRKPPNLKEPREHQAPAGWRLGRNNSSSSKPLPITMQESATLKVGQCKSPMWNSRKSVTRPHRMRSNR